jgi:hypothetical protein
MRTLRILAATVVAAMACSSSGPKAARAPEAPATEARAERQLPEGFSRLVVAVERLPATARDPEHAGMVSALRELATVLEAADRVHAARIRELATEFERSGPDDPHADLAKNAIGEALIAIDQWVRTRDDEPGARAAYVVATRAFEELTPDRPLVPQMKLVTTAFEALTDAIAISHGGRAPFEHDRAAIAEVDREQLRQRVARVDELVSDLARERDWADAREAAARALAAIADTIEALPTARRDRIAELTTTVRFEASRLARANELALRRTEVTRRGLVAAVAAIQELAAPAEGSAAAHLLATAHRAATAIEEASTFIFQRPRIQEAFRAVADTLVVLATTEDGIATTARR